MNRIADLRHNLHTLEDADHIFQELAMATKTLRVADARLELKIAKIQELHAEQTTALRLRVDGIKAELAAFVAGHEGLFEKPRTRKSAFGEYGLRTATELEVQDEDAMLDAVKHAKYYECFSIVYKVDKTNIRKRVVEGEKIPGCTVKTGNTVVCKVAKALLDQADQEAAL
jgi:hypothetical protein